MQTELRDHALKNIWCDPSRDKQYAVAGKRVSPVSGALNFFKFFERPIHLPVTGKRFHVYHIGAVPPSVMGLLQNETFHNGDHWTCFKDAINQSSLFVDIYTVSGLQFPRFNSYYLWSRERGLLFAVDAEIDFPFDFVTGSVYLRVYSNDFYRNQANAGITPALYTNGIVATSVNQIAALQTEELSYRALPGGVLAFKNGLKIDKIDLVNVVVGDTVEFVYDRSIKYVEEIQAASLLSFSSQVDARSKFLIHPGRIDDLQINFYDDVDFYVIAKRSETRYSGNLYHRNSADAVRMVTHHDYAIPTPYYHFTAERLLEVLGGDPIDPENFYVQLVVRASGTDRPLIYERNRIFELYKLTSDQIYSIMSAETAVVPVWQAAHLEASAYTRCMNKPYNQITQAAVEDALGYNAVSSLVAGTPQLVEVDGETRYVNLPVGLWNNATIFEYDVNGLLLGHSYHDTGNALYVCAHAEAVLVEVIYGQATDTPEVRFGTDQIDLIPYLDYRVYFTLVVDGIATGGWTDITDSTYYEISEGRVVWVGEPSDHLLMVRFNNKFLYREVEYTPAHGVIKVQLMEYETRHMSPGQYPLPIPLGELDVWLNEHPLVEGIDYFLVFPDVYIVSKKWMEQPILTTPQRVAYRFTGFADSSLNPEPVDDIGFIEYGLLSNNLRYDIRDDKVMRIIVDGGLKHRGQLVFSERHSGVFVDDAKNGTPYQLRDMTIPLEGLVSATQVDFRQAARAVDKQVSDYLTVQLPQPDRTGPSVAQQIYKLISPFFAHITFDVLTGVIDSALINKVMTDAEVLAVAKDYEYLLAADPIRKPYLTDTYVEIIPHPLDTVVELHFYQYKFISALVRLYGNTRINLSAFYVMSTN